MWNICIIDGRDISGAFIRIMRDMELINDMGSYYILYELLSKEMNSSRKVTEQIESLAKEQRFH